MAVQYATEETQQKALHEDWQINWEHRVENAKTRPAMFIGRLETAHRSAVSDALALVRKARAFRVPKLSTVHLSPTKYSVRAEAGPLLPAIEEMHTWSDKLLLEEGWDQVYERLSQQRFDRLVNGKHDFTGWKKCFAGQTGPTLDRPLSPAVLARRFTFAYKTSEGFWGQAFKNGNPLDKPFLLTQPSDVGLLILAELDPHWFTGLPFTPDDVQQLCVHADIAAVWHDQGADLNVEASSADDIYRWLQDPVTKGEHDHA